MAGIQATGALNFPFTNIDLTSQVIRIPNVWGMINAMDLFGPGEGQSTTIVEIVYGDGEIRVLGAESRDGDLPAGKNNNEGAKYFKIPHFPGKENITVSDIQDKWEIVNGVRKPRTLADVVAKKGMKIRQTHAQTLEFLRMGAIKGQIIDGKGVTIYNLYDVFGITKKVFYFDLSKPETNVRAICNDISRWMVHNARGAAYEGIKALVSREFFEALTSHPNVEKFFLNWQAATSLSGDLVGSGFRFGPVEFVEYDGVVTNMKKQSVRMVAEGAGHAFPMKSTDVFAQYNGPANTIELANTVGPEIFVSQKVLDHGRGFELLHESNPLPIVKRPELVVELQMGAAPP
jgi:hypothetical protein